MRVLWLSRYQGNLNGYRPEGEILVDLKKTGVDIDFMGTGDTPYLQRLRYHGIPVIPFEIPRHKLAPGAICAIRRQLMTGHYDIVQAFQGKAIAAMLMAAVGIRVKTVAYRGQTGNIFRYDPSSYLTMLHPRLDGITCVAKAIEKDLRLRLWSRWQPRITTIYKGHDVCWYRRQPVDLAQRLGIPPGSFVVGFAANVRPRKGLPVLLQAAHYLPADAPIHVLLMGRGTDSNSIRRLIAALPCPQRFHPLGYRRDVLELLSSCQASVMPTLKREGLSRSIIESMAMEIPVIASDTGGNAELVRDEVAGLVVPPAAPRALAAAIMRLYRDPTWAAQLGRQARQRIIETFNHEETVRRYHDFYRALLNKDETVAEPGREEAKETP